MSKNVIIAVTAGFAAGILVMLVKDVATCRKTPEASAGKTQVATKTEKADNLSENKKQLTERSKPRPRRQVRKQLMREDFDQWFAELKDAHAANDVKRVDELLAEMEQHRRQLQELREAILEHRQGNSSQESAKKETVTGP